MVKKRTYGDSCGVARALDVLGERWALLVVRELLLGAKRFTDLRVGLPHVSPDILSQRLRELEESGVVRRRTLAPPAGSRVYELTERGTELESIILELGRWGSAVPFPPGDAPLGTDSFVIALKTVFRPPSTAAPSGSYELRLDAVSFRAEVAAGRLEVIRDTAPHPDAVIDSDPDTLSAVLWHGRELEQAERAGAITITGSRRAATRFLRMFPPPQ